MQKRHIYMLLGWLMQFGWQQSFAQTDTLCDPNENKKIFGELYFNYGSASNVYSQFNRSTFIVGQPLASRQSMLSQTRQSGFGVYSPWYLPPQPPIILATQGDFKDRIKISWNVNPLSPVPSGFILYRDGSFLADLGENVRDYLDFNTQAGEYYEYSIEAKNVFGTGSPSKAVGFVNPNGVVSGKIETNSGNPVPGVEVRLTPLTGNSMSFDGVNDELCVTYHEEFPTDKFTVLAYVKLGDVNNEGAIIDWGSTLNKNWWITTTPSNENKGFIFHIGNGTGSDSLKYYLPNTITNPNNVNDWHQVTMVYNGSALSVMVDGEFIGTKPASIIREKNYLNIGSKIGNNGFFKGKIDDIRVYNRPLTQTEVNSTKNRSVSKNENGLVSYWKMDEGIGAKVFDNTTISTNANIYGATFSSDKPEVYSAGVSDVTGYYVIDGINYSQVESFRVTPMKNFDFNSSVEFNAADKSYGNLTDYDMPDTSTVELLFHPFDLKSRQTVASKGNLYEAYIDNGNLFLNLNGTTTDLGVIKAKFYHLAVTLDNTAGSAKIYLEGELKQTVSFTGISNWKNGNPWLLATNSTNAATGKFYTGLVDEFYIYKSAMPQNVIQEHFVLGVPQDSTTALLYSHFDLNEGSDTKIYDYAIINFGAETPREGILTKANWSNNARRKETKPHEFEPNIRVVNLNTSNTAIGNIDFRDVSTVNVSGYVRFANTFCFEDKVEIKVNGQSYFPPIMTDKDGKWSADFEPGRTVKLTAVYKDHLFGPSFFEIRKLQAPKAGIVFLDNTKRTIRGQVAGNDLCRKSIIPSGSRVVVKIATLDGCFEKTDTLRNPDGRFIFSNLPARAFRVSVVEHSNSVIYNYLQLKGGQEVDLRDAVSDTTDFIYTAPPNVEIEPFPVIDCAGGNEFRIIVQSHNENSPPYKKKIKVFEQYDGGKCYLSNAKLSIDNQIQGSNIEVFQMDSSIFIYPFLAGAPNIISPYKKNMQVTATVNGATATATDEVIVVGSRSRETTFTTEAPSNKPIWILRDPPGDRSFATLEAGSTKCEVMTNTISKTNTNSLALAFDIGKKTKNFAGAVAGVLIGGVIEENGVVSTNTLTGTLNYNGVTTGETEVCYTTTQSYSTSADEVIVGRMADVFIGTSMNFEYGVTDVIYYDPQTCSIKDTLSVYLDPKKFGTQYVYSRWQIMTDVIPSLEALGKFEDANRWREILKEDEYYLVPRRAIEPIQGLVNQVIDDTPISSVIPYQIINLSKKLINSSVDYLLNGIDEIANYINGGAQVDTIRYVPKFDKNISFDGLSSYSQSWAKTDKRTTTTKWDLGASFAYNLSTEITLFSNTVSTKVDINNGINYEETVANSNQKSSTITYTLADKDANDNFSVDILKKGDLPLFKLKAGESMCPWEYGTLNREEVGVRSDYTKQVNVPANTEATFPIHLQNLGQAGDNLTCLIGEVLGANPRGAKIKLNGAPLVTPVRVQLLAGQELNLLLTVEKGPIDFNYDSLKIFIASECMYNHSLNLGYDISKELGYLKPEVGIIPGTNPNIYANLNQKFYKQLKLGVEFIEPCSQVDIGFPLQNFVVTPAAENILSVTLNEYNKSDEDLKLIRLQYRPIGGDGSWINISETPKVALGDVFTLKEWNTELLKDGPYEIRAIAECFDVTLAPGISTVIRGTLEREPPELVGIPEPGDGTWDPGDEISITFNEPINCDKVVQADILSNNTIGLYDATTNALVDATISCVGNKIVIVPNINPVFFENRVFRVQVSGKDYDDAKTAENPNHQAAAIRDKAGNMIPKTIKWEFAVNQNNLEWVGTDVIESNEVLKPFSVKRQVRNRGGSIASFRMENIPSWLTVSPSTGTLNPGQVADVTLTFQQDLLIGDYLDTLQMVGSRGKEPLLIDYRVRCPQSAYVVDNPAQYVGSMNMVIDLNIFGLKSKDPSDIMVAKIDGQVRGVGRVQYYRNIPTEGTDPNTGLPDDSNRWLTFLTIYGNSSDIDKQVEFAIWDGDKCNEYVEVLEQITYQEGGLVGSPLEPQPIHVLNLVKKSIALNKGFNWVSFSLNLGAGNNTFTKVLSSLKNKIGAMIKTDDNFAIYDNGAWDTPEDVVLPTKRYLIYVAEKDTINIKGEPYTASSFPITIKAKPQWNWLGYVPSTGMTVTQALRGLTPLNGDIIKSQTLFAQYVAGVGWIGNLSFLEPLKGYLLRISNTGNLTYNTNLYVSRANLGGESPKTPLSPAELISEQSLLNQADLEAPMIDDFTKYQSNMNLIGRVKGMTIDPDDELRAYVDGKLVGRNKSINHKVDRLFFSTIYFEDEQTVSFKLFKADRNKEFVLNKNIQFKADALSGLVENPIVFELVNSANPAVTVKIEDQIIKRPNTVYGTVSILANITENNPNCSLYAVSTILPTGTDTKPNCTAQTLEGSMTSVIKVYFSELSSFVSDQDALTFINSTTGETVGCGVFRTNNSLFYTTIGGSATSTAVPLDVVYFSNSMKKSFTLKKGFTYNYNTVRGTGSNPFKLDFSPLAISIDANGLITTTMRDTSWVGSYGVKAFAMNCSGFNDGEATFNFRRILDNDCSYSFSTPTSNSPVCDGSKVILGANKGDSYLWTGPNGFTSTMRNPEIVTANSSKAGIYTLSVSSLGCTTSSTTSITVKSISKIVSSNAPVCENSMLNLSSSVGESHAWRGPNSFTSTIQNPEIANVTMAASGIYTVVISNNGCKDSTTTEVLVKLLPVIEMEANIDVCEAGTLQLNSNGGNSYLWTGPNLFSSTLQNPQILNVSSDNGGIYTARVTLNGCTNEESSTVKIIPLPAIPKISGTSEICAGTQLTLEATSASNGTFTWSNNIIGNKLDVTPTGNISYTVSLMLNNCKSTSVPFDIKVNPLYNSPVITADNVEICKGNNAILSASCPAESIFRWIPSVASSNQNLGLSNTNVRIVSEPGTYTGICEPPNGCPSAKVNVVINQSANCSSQSFITLSPAKPVICPNKSVTITAAGCGGTLSWLGGSTTLTGNSATLSPTATTTYLVQCSTGGYTTVTVEVASANVVVNSNITTGSEIVKAINTIESDKKIGSANFTPAPSVSYEAGNAILLKPGFSTEKYSIFKAEIKTCPPTPN